MIGKTDQANHQYDIVRLSQALAAHNLPAVSFVKAPAYQDGHPNYSDPLREQTFLVGTINQLMQAQEWQSMAIIIMYDDSDGSYDHVMSPTINESQTSADSISAPGQSGTRTPLGGYQGRYALGPRLPLLILSPFAKNNFVDHSLVDQASILRFIEDNWQLGRIGNFAFDAQAGSLLNMFDFSQMNTQGSVENIPATD